VTMKKCKKDNCLTLVSDPKANYCKRHAGKNPLLEKSFERGLMEYYQKLVSNPKSPLRGPKQ
jgi:hypothetical protein